MEENKFNQIIKSENFALASDLSEVVLDSFIDNEILKDIPMIGTISKLLSLGTTINDRLFTKKLLHFLRELENIDQNLILKEIQYIDDSKKYNQKVGEKILEVINRVDSDDKPKVIGKLFRNFLLKKITYFEFLRLSHIIENVFILDLLILSKSKEHITLKNNKITYLPLNENSKELFNYNIVDNITPNDYVDPKDITVFQSSVKLTTLGLNILNYGLK
ncbi:hypothetical protein [Chryseobacterium taiwanense]|uniref:DUF4393 domain-containing protein n=1 Tax=Chryseobacterium taiwanense TaxID=363331 RepID=A0A0B4E8B6_9FLAO|nr:hypothetical protein [Chryseobacterium taiwanense]KIC62883.1 hypothetical protein RM51_09480 [Chryseobacterium taiwanense]